MHTDNTMIDESREIDALHARWADAMSRGDVGGVMAMLEPSYVLLRPGVPELTRDALRPLLVAAFTQGQIQSSFECEARIVREGLVVERGWDVQTVVPANGEPQRSGRQRVTIVLRRAEDGEWRFAWGMGMPASP